MNIIIFFLNFVLLEIDCFLILVKCQSDLLAIASYLFILFLTIQIRKVNQLKEMFGATLPWKMCKHFMWDKVWPVTKLGALKLLDDS